MRLRDDERDSRGMRIYNDPYAAGLSSAATRLSRKANGGGGSCSGPLQKNSWSTLEYIVFFWLPQVPSVAIYPVIQALKAY